jgi:hypothetical protein
MNKQIRSYGLIIAIVGSILAGVDQRALAQSIGSYGSVKLVWKLAPIIKLTITPNYQSGFGPQGGAGSGSTPAPGPGATLGGGVVDFGSNVVQGYEYLYKYAAQASVLSTDASGFTVYAEGSSDVQDLTVGGTMPLNQTLYWLPSNSSNTPFSPATGFNATTSPVGCGGTCINYATNPPGSAVVWNYPTATMGLPGNSAIQGWDYGLRLFNSNPDRFQVYIVYTAVGN